MPPDIPDVRPRTLGLSSLTRKQNIWALFIFFISVSSVLLGFSVAVSLKSPIVRPNGCDNRSDPAFWELLGQTLLRLLLVLCLFVPVLRDRRNVEGLRTLRINSYLIYYLTIGVSFASELAALVLYATLCGNDGWLAELLLGWVGALTAAGAAAQLAVALER
ncbi:hypothetical protein HD806DRAFT_543509 [Xylariaceae sp. AK1471]|nr:hypothetical protein HD806DRAFT_543509 [Xylariaceae sp. AK1471]